MVRTKKKSTLLVLKIEDNVCALSITCVSSALHQYPKFTALLFADLAGNEYK